VWSSIAIQPISCVIYLNKWAHIAQFTTGIILSMRVILEDLVVSQLVKKIPVLFVTINAFGESSDVKK
jgi:hypothetical protein